MTVYPPYMQRQAEKKIADRNEVIADRMAVCISVVALIGIVWAMLMFFVDAAVLTVENEEQYNKRTWTVEQTYSRPAAFRLASPNWDQAEKYHDLVKVMEIKNATKQRGE